MAHRRRSRRNPSPSVTKFGVGALAAAAPLVSKLALDGPAVPVAGAIVLAAYAAGKARAVSPDVSTGAMLGGLAGLAFSVLYNLRGASAELVRATSPDMRGVG
jgi:hypothetical protein